MSIKGRARAVVLGSVVGLALGTLAPSATFANARTTSTLGNRNHSNYVEVPLTSLKGSLASGDPSQLPLLALSSTMDAYNHQPQVELDRSNPARITAWVTYSGLADDSLKGIRYRVEMVLSDSLCTCQRWKVSWVGRQYQCQFGRGSQDWSGQTCH